MRKINIKNGIIEDIFTYEDRVREYQKERDYKIIFYDVSDNIISIINAKKDISEDDKQKLQIRTDIDKEYSEKIEYLNSCYELIEIPYNGDTFNEEIYTLVPQFKTINNIVEQTYQPKLDKYKISKKIAELKRELADTDYIVVKSYEAKLLNEDMPYSQETMESVFSERQKKRDKINSLSNLIK